MKPRLTKIGIIGIGYWGPNLVRVFSEFSESRVVAVSDINQDRLNIIGQKYPEVRRHTNYRDILKDKEIQAVVVATNLSTHFGIVRDALSAGKHVLVEKPLTDSVKNAKALVSLAKKNSRILMVGHTFLFNAGIIRLKEYIKTREIGDLFYMHAVRTNLGPIRKDANALWDLASHDISIFLYLLGKMPVKVSASGGVYLRKGVEDAVFLTMKFPDNVVGNIHVSWLEPCKVRTLTLIGENKMVVFDDINQLEPIRIYDKGVTKEKRYDTFGEFQLILRDGNVLIPKISLSEPLKNECSEFLKAVRGKGKPVSDGEFGVKVVKVLCAAQRSLKRDGAPERVI
jgi:predicted dehydrogenase